jgi:hypothetical protein
MRRPKGGLHRAWLKANLFFELVMTSVFTGFFVANRDALGGAGNAQWRAGVCASGVLALIALLFS